MLKKEADQNNSRYVSTETIATGNITRGSQIAYSKLGIYSKLGVNSQETKGPVFIRSTFKHPRVWTAPMKEEIETENFYINDS